MLVLGGKIITIFFFLAGLNVIIHWVIFFPPCNLHTVVSLNAKKTFHSNGQRKDGDKLSTERHGCETAWEAVHPADCQHPFWVLPDTYCRLPSESTAPGASAAAWTSSSPGACAVFLLCKEQQSQVMMSILLIQVHPNIPLGTSAQAASAHLKLNNCCLLCIYLVVGFSFNISFLPSPQMDAVSPREEIFSQQKGWCDMKTAKVELWSPAWTKAAGSPNPTESQCHTGAPLPSASSMRNPGCCVWLLGKKWTKHFMIWLTGQHDTVPSLVPYVSKNVLSVSQMSPDICHQHLNGSCPLPPFPFLLPTPVHKLRAPWKHELSLHFMHFQCQQISSPAGRLCSSGTIQNNYYSNNI